jgi:hypothetical protein
MRKRTLEIRTTTIDAGAVLCRGSSAKLGTKMKHAIEIVQLPAAGNFDPKLEGFGA